MTGKEKDVLPVRQIQDLFCLRAFVVSSDPPKRHFFEESLDNVTFVTWKRQPT